MKVLMVLVACMASAYAGVGVVTPQIEAEALRLWQRFCGGQRSEGGNDGGVSVYCKISLEDHNESRTHNLELPKSRGGEQVVFVQPPSYHYTHDVVVTGGGGKGPKTVIYVKPAKNTNEVNIDDQTRPTGAPQKPSLFFLAGDHGADNDDTVEINARTGSRPSAETVSSRTSGEYP